MNISKEIENIFFSSVDKTAIPFEIISIENLYKRFGKSPFSLHRLQFYALVIIIEGKSMHTVDFNKRLLFPGVILPLTKGQVHAFNKKERVKGFVISFEEQFITENSSEKNLFHFLHLFHNSELFIGTQNLEELLPFITILQDVQNNTNPTLKSDFVKAIFTALIIQIKRLMLTPPKNFSNQRFKDFIAFKVLLAQYYPQSHNAKDYAQKLAISYKYLNDICKEIANSTAKAFIDNWLMLEIKRNISEKKYTSQEIAYKMGFSEPTNFNPIFQKTHRNDTP